MGIEPTPSAWKAEVLPLNYTRLAFSERGYSLARRAFRATSASRKVVEGEGFEPSKAEPTDLQSAPFDRSGTPPKFKTSILTARGGNVNWRFEVFAK